MEFGIFDHLDRGDISLQDFYENRLRLVEAYDRNGFYSYHVAEHHATPLGMAPSPSVYMAAVAQRTRWLRFGPLVYTLPLYHPIRLTEEICMLDQMSHGRLQLGIGRGISPIENAYYGLKPEEAKPMYEECWQIIRQGLATQRVDFHGKFYTFKNVPISLEPVQRPHPPLWYGVSTPDVVEWPARQGIHAITNNASPVARQITDGYRAVWRSLGKDEKDLPKLGMTRFLVIADTDEQAIDAGRQAYRRWYSSFMHLWKLHGRDPVIVSFPEEIDGLLADGRAVCGSAESVTENLRKQTEEAGINYLMCRFAFGALPVEDSLRSVEFFARDVMPVLRALRPAA